MASRLIRERAFVGPVTLATDVRFTRADLEIYRINTFRPSFVGHIFLNDAGVTADALDEPDTWSRSSYAGRFAVFGHQRCFGDEGHCAMPGARRRFDDRPSAPLTPAFRRVVITDGLRRALAGGQELTVTIITTASSDDDGDYEGPLLDFEGIQVATFL